jgi:hypothetical protein
MRLLISRDRDVEKNSELGSQFLDEGQDDVEYLPSLSELDCHF